MVHVKAKIYKPLQMMEKDTDLLSQLLTS